MENFASKVVKQAKSIMAKNNIQQQLNSPAFNNIGLLIITRENMENVIDLLFKNDQQLKDNQQFKQKLINVLQTIKSKVPAAVDKFVKTKTIGFIMKYRQNNEIFSEKMNEIAEYVKEQFSKIMETYSQDSVVEKAIKNWNIK